MGFARAQGIGRPGGFGSAQGTGRGFQPSQGAEGSAAFSPSDIAGLKGWWKFDDATQLFQLSNGTTAVTADADPIGYVTDLSGSGNHLIQATAGSRPLWKTGIQNSKACALFDGVDDQLSKAVVAVSGANATMFCVVKATANKGKFFQNGTGSGYQFNQDTANRDFLAENVANQDDAAMSHVAFEVWVGTVAGATPLWVLRVNASGVTLTPNNSAPIAPANNTVLGGDGGANSLTGYIAEAGIYDSVLSAGNLTTLDTYLNSAARWAVY